MNHHIEHAPLLRTLNINDKTTVYIYILYKLTIKILFVLQKKKKKKKKKNHDVSKFPIPEKVDSGSIALWAHVILLSDLSITLNF